MELDQTLTTGDDSLQVNSSEQDILNEEVTAVNDEDVSTNLDNSISNEQAEAEAYSDAWEKTDLSDDSVFDTLFADTNDTTDSGNAEPAVDLLSEEVTNNTNNNIGAFLAEKPVLKFKGKEIPIDSPDELINLAQKGMQMETAAAEMKPKKKVLGIIEGIPLEVLQAVADVHGGNTGAIEYIKSQYGIQDKVSSEDDNGFWGNKKEEAPKQEKESYTPEVKTENPMEEFWASYSSSNQQMAGKVSETYSGLDESFKGEIYDPKVFPAFVSSVESGEFDSAYPMAIKEKSLNPAMTWLQAYAVAVQKSGAPKSTQAEPPASATIPSNNAQSRQMSDTASADRVWNDDAYFNELEAKLFG